MPVRLEGAIALNKALKAFAPDLAKELRKEMATSLKPVVKKAKSFIPSEGSVLTNWRISNKSDTATFPYFDFKAAKGGIGYKTSPSKMNKKGFVNLAEINNKTASGAIFETAGRKNPIGQPWNPKSGSKKFSRSANPNAGRMFINAANAVSALYGKGNDRGRAIYRAWEEDQGKAQDGVVRAIEKSAIKFNERASRG